MLNGIKKTVMTSQIEMITSHRALKRERGLTSHWSSPKIWSLRLSWWRGEGRGGSAYRYETQRGGGER